MIAGQQMCRLFVVVVVVIVAHAAKLEPASRLRLIRRRILKLDLSLSCARAF